MWGLGLVLHILLCGKHPFESDDMYGAITSGKLTLSEPVWQVVAPSCLDLVRSLLKPLPKDRLSAEQVLLHPWMKDGMASKAELEVSLSELGRYISRQVRHSALKALASALKPAEIAEAQMVFDWIDEDDKGSLHAEDIEMALKGKAHRTLGWHTWERPKCASRFNLPLLLRRLQSQLCAKGNAGVITFEDFVRAMLEVDDELIKQQLLKVFGGMDELGTGVLVLAELICKKTPRCIQVSHRRSHPHSRGFAGKIHVDDIRRTLNEFGLEADGLGGVERFLRNAANDEGYLSYDEFIELFLRLHREIEVSRRVGVRESRSTKTRVPVDEDSALRPETSTAIHEASSAGVRDSVAAIIDVDVSISVSNSSLYARSSALSSRGRESTRGNPSSNPRKSSDPLKDPRTPVGLGPPNPLSSEPANLQIELGESTRMPRSTFAKQSIWRTMSGIQRWKPKVGESARAADPDESCTERTTEALSPVVDVLSHRWSVTDKASD